MKCPKTALLLFLAMLMLICPAYSGVWYVPDSIVTIQAAIDTAVDQDYIKVAGGNYLENLNFNGKYIRLESLEGAEATIIQPVDPEVSTIICDAGARGYLDGFTISGGGNANTIDISGGADISVRNCIFHDNIPDLNYEHDVIFCDSAEVDVFRCLFYDNGGDYCVTVYPSSEFSSLIHCTFNNNHKAACSNSTFFEVKHCIISNCDSGLVAGGYVDILAYLCDFWNCGLNYNEYCIVDDNTIIPFDPLYIDADLANYYLQEMSPCIDAGFAEHSGELDPDGTAPDLGALAFATNFPIAAGINFVPSFDPLGFHFVNSLTPEIVWSYDDNDQGTSQAQYQIQVGSDNDWAVAEMWDKGPEFSSDTSVLYDGLPLENHTVYYVRIRTNDGTDWGNWRLQWFHARVSGRVYVPEQFETIGEAVFAALDGDTIMVGPGEYNEVVSFDGRPLKIISTGGPETTAINSNAVNGMGVDAELSGFTLTGDLDNPLIVMSGNSRLSNCIIRDNTPDGDNDELIKASGEAEVANNIFYNNGGISCVGIRNYEDEVKIVNNVFNDNWRGFFNLVDNNSMAVNNVIINSRDYGVYGANKFTVFDANVVYGNGYNRMYWQSLGTENMEFDPVFADAENHDYSLNPLSPCIDNGYPDPAYNDEDGTRGDVGAIPTAADFPIATSISFGPESVDHELFSLWPVFHWSYMDPAKSTQQQYEIKLNDDVTWQEEPIWAVGPVSSSDTSIIYDGPQLIARKTYFVAIRVHDGTDWGDWRVGWFKVQVPGMIRVPEHYESLFDAIDAALDGDTILVGPGTYAGRFYIDNGVRLISSHGPEATVLAPGPDYQEIIHVEDCVGCDTVEISGFTFVGGGWHNVVYIHRPSESAPVIVSNNVFDNCVGSENAAAVRCLDGRVIIKNNLITDNIGTGIDVDDDIYEAVLRNNTLDNNYRGIIIENHNAIVIGNIITGSINYGAYASDSINVLFDYNDFYGNILNYAYQAKPGANDIYEDPLYINAGNNDYSLHGMSPCIDAGHPDAQYNDPDGTRNDMGAYYFAHSLVIMDPDPILNTGEIDDTSLADIYFGNLIGDYTVNDVNTSTLMVNGSVVPTSVEVIVSHPEFNGEVLNIKVNLAAFLETYGPIYGLVFKNFTLSGEYNDATPFTATGRVEILNAIPGDMNDDNGVNLLDITFAIEYLYMDGPAPNPVYGDVNADCTVNILDVVYLIAYIYQGGPAPNLGCW